MRFLSRFDDIDVYSSHVIAERVLPIFADGEGGLWSLSASYTTSWGGAFGKVLNRLIHMYMRLGLLVWYVYCTAASTCSRAIGATTM